MSRITQRFTSSIGSKVLVAGTGILLALFVIGHLAGNLLVSRAWGHHPRAAPLLEAAIAPLFVAAHGGMCWMADRVVRKGARHKGLAYVHGGGGGV